jgi:branched-chain amino acid transport system substrate-binding protein
MVQAVLVLVLLVGLAFPPPSWAGGEPVKLGALYNLSGGMSSIDNPAMKGASLKIDQVNRAGGVLGGRRVVLLVVNTKTDLEAAAAGAERLLAEGVAAGLGYGDTSYVMAAAPLFQKAKIPFVTSGATLPSLPERIGDSFFMACFGDDDQARAIADYAYDTLEARRAAVWTDQSGDFTRALSRYFQDRFTENGGRIGPRDDFRAGDRDFSGLIERLRNTDPKPDAVFVSATPDEAGLIVKQIREAGLDLPIISGDGFDTQLVVSVPGPDLADGVYFATHGFRGDQRPEVAEFAAAYREKYGRGPENAFAALGYDAAGLIVDAIRRAGSADGDELRDALNHTADYQGVTGEIAYTRPSRVPVKPVAVVGVHDGRFELESTWRPNGE